MNVEPSRCVKAFTILGKLAYVASLVIAVVGLANAFPNESLGLTLLGLTGASSVGLSMQWGRIMGAMKTEDQAKRKEITSLAILAISSYLFLLIAILHVAGAITALHLNALILSGFSVSLLTYVGLANRLCIRIKQ